MFALNKEARDFIQNNFITVRNGFVNDGLINHCFIDFSTGKDFDNYEKLETLYL